MNIDLNKALQKTIRTGKVLIGSNVSIVAAQKESTLAIVLAANCPPKIRAQIQDCGTQVIEYPGRSVDLGVACGKPFPIASLTILDPGDSNVMAVFGAVDPAETQEPQEMQRQELQETPDEIVELS